MPASDQHPPQPPRPPQLPPPARAADAAALWPYPLEAAPQPLPVHWAPPKPRRSPWVTAGIVLVVFLAIAGLIAIALIVMFFIALSSWGSNK